MKDKNLFIMMTTIFMTIFILGIILVALFNQGVANIENMILDQSSTIASQISNVDSSISSVMQDIQDMLNKQDSLIAGYTFSYGNIDAKALSCDVTVSITPKTFSADTTAKLYIGDKEAAMTRKGNAYEATVEVPITAAYDNVSVTFEQSGTSQSEVLPEAIDAGGQLLSSFYIEPTVNENSLTEGILIDGSISYSAPSDMGDNIASIKIVAEQNGKESWSMNSDHPEINQQISFSHTFKADFPDEIMIYVEFTGSSGLKYRYTIFGYYERSSDGIYDTNGKLIIQLSSPYYDLEY